MPWPCYVVETISYDPPIPHPDLPNVWTTMLFRAPDGSLVDYRKLKVGAIFVHPTRGIRVKLPGLSGTNGWDMEQEGSPGHHWKVTGTIPLVTATPSINCVNVYHGYVTDGVVTDDVEGRKFDDYGHSQVCT